MELEEARAHVIANLDEGVICPCCSQRAQRYRRKLDSLMARGLVRMYVWFRDHPGVRWMHVERELKSDPLSPGGIGRQVATLKYWGLIRLMRDEEPDGAAVRGYYRITKRGRQFVRGQITLPRYIFVYNNTLFGFDGSEITDIQTALTDKFSYTELMGRAYRQSSELPVNSGYP